MPKDEKHAKCGSAVEGKKQSSAPPEEDQASLLENAAYRQIIKKQVPSKENKGSADDSENDEEESASESSEMIPVEDRISAPNPSDIVFGRGRPYQMHEGNQHLLSLVDQHRGQYFRSKRLDKNSIAKNIVSIIKQESGRFLKRKGDFWVEVSDTVALHKVSHALRSKARKQQELPNETGRAPVPTPLGRGENSPDATASEAATRWLGGGRGITPPSLQSGISHGQMPLSMFERSMTTSGMDLLQSFAQQQQRPLPPARLGQQGLFPGIVHHHLWPVQRTPHSMQTETSQMAHLLNMRQRQGSSSTQTDILQALGLLGPPTQHREALLGLHHLGGSIAMPPYLPGPATLPSTMGQNNLVSLNGLAMPSHDILRIARGLELSELQHAAAAASSRRAPNPTSSLEESRSSTTDEAATGRSAATSSPDNIGSLPS